MFIGISMTSTQQINTRGYVEKTTEFNVSIGISKASSAQQINTRGFVEKKEFNVFIGISMTSSTQHLD